MPALDTASIWAAMLGLAAVLVVDLVLVPFAMPFHGGESRTYLL